MSSSSFGGFKKEYIGVATSDSLNFNSKFSPGFTVDAATKKYVDDTMAGVPDSPAGNDTEVQYNNSGVFAASPTFTYTAGSGTVTVPNVTAASDATGDDIVVTGTLSANNVLPTTSFESTSSLTVSGASSGPTCTVGATTGASASAGTELTGEFAATGTMTAADAEIDQRLVVGPSSLGAGSLISVNSSLGFLPPRMTTAERTAIASPSAGLVVYDTTDNRVYFYNGSAWNAMYTVKPNKSALTASFAPGDSQSVSAGSTVIYTTLDVVEGSRISYNTSTGLLTLTSAASESHRFLLTAVTQCFSTSGNIPQFGWCDGSGTLLSGANSFTTTVTASTDNSSTSSTQAIVELGPADLSGSYTLRCVAIDSGFTFVTLGSHISIIELQV